MERKSDFALRALLMLGCNIDGATPQSGNGNDRLGYVDALPLLREWDEGTRLVARFGYYPLLQELLQQCTVIQSSFRGHFFACVCNYKRKRGGKGKG